MNPEAVDALAATLGYHPIGGMQTNRVYLHDEKQEILKVSITSEAETLTYAEAQFGRCLEVSAVYAPTGIMPEVFEIGDDFQGSGYPWLREQYIAGNNLGTEYLTDTSFCLEHAPHDIVRLCTVMASTTQSDVSATWTAKIEGMTCPSGFEDIYKEVVRAGRYLAEQATTGHLIHGDLQFGNIVVQRGAQGSRSWLIDWEVSEVMPLAYEFAMLYTFLLGPEGQVEAQQRAQYERLKPLTAFWNALKPLLLSELGIPEDTFKHAVVFRMGNGWLYQLEQAIKRGATARAKELEHDLRALVSHRVFEILPYP